MVNKISLCGRRDAAPMCGRDLQVPGGRRRVDALTRHYLVFGGEFFGDCSVLVQISGS